MKYLFLTALVFVVSVFFYGCSDENQNLSDLSESKNQSLTIGDIAYDKNNSNGYRIYLKENENLIPFFVLTSDYDGYCLILREFLLDEYVVYNTPREYASYYADSNIDVFLNQTYYSQLSQDIQQLIVPCKIEITTKNAIDTHDNETEIIERNVFLLSANEVNSSLSRAAIKEGKPLLFFDKTSNRIATFDNLESSSWLLRTPALRDGNTIIGVADDGSIGMGGISTITGSGVGAGRPAFCIPANVPITLENTDTGEKRFLLNKKL